MTLTYQLRLKHLAGDDLSGRNGHVALSKTEFNGVGGLPTYHQLHAFGGRSSERSFPMSNTSVKLAIVLFMVLAIPAASFARSGGARGGGSAATGNLGGGRPNAGALNGALSNMSADPSRVGNAARVAAPPPPRISVPTIPQFK